jgi:hypothetical protein
MKRLEEIELQREYIQDLLREQKIRDMTPSGTLKDIVRQKTPEHEIITHFST